MDDDVIDAEVMDDDVNMAGLPVLADSALIVPAASVDQIVHAFEQYQLLSRRLLDKSDYQRIRDKQFPKRSAWRKLGVAYGVTFEIIKHDKHRNDSGIVTDAEFIVRASAPNGRFADGWGACDLWERCCLNGCTKRHQHCPVQRGDECAAVHHWSHPNHDIPATAETRAKNRASADLFGLGTVSAEEIADREDREPEGETMASAEQVAEFATLARSLSEESQAQIRDWLKAKSYVLAPDRLTEGAARLVKARLEAEMAKDAKGGLKGTQEPPAPSHAERSKAARENPGRPFDD